MEFENEEQLVSMENNLEMDPSPPLTGLFVSAAFFSCASLFLALSRLPFPVFLLITKGCGGGLEFPWQS